MHLKAYLLFTYKQLSLAISLTFTNNFYVLKLNNRNTTVVLLSLLLTLNILLRTYFTPFYGASNVDFEQVNVYCDGHNFKIFSQLIQPFFKSSHQRCSVRKGVLRNFAKLTGKHLCQSLFFNKAAGLRPAALLKKRLWHRCFPVNFTKFLRTTFLTEHL